MAGVAKTDRYQVGLGANPLFICQPDTPDGTLELRSGDANTAGTVVRRLDTPVVLPVAPTTSGSVVEFVIPAWARRITLALSTVSTNGTGIPQVQLGTASAYTVTGYNGAINFVNGSASVAGGNISTGFVLYPVATTAATVWSGIMELVRLDGVTWACRTNLSLSGGTPVSLLGAGDVSLGGTATRIRLITGGSDVFDLGKVACLFE